MTAVEWLIEELHNYGIHLYKDKSALVRAANVIMKKQIVDAWRNGDNDSAYSAKELDQQAEQYYNDTYNTKTHTS